MNKEDKNLVKLIPGIVITLSFLLFLSFILYKYLMTEPKGPDHEVMLAPDQDIHVITRIEPDIYVAEPFEYQIRVIYRPGVVSPDFRQLLRDVNFVPFEQKHKSRTSIIKYLYDENINEYVLSYSIVGIDVLPGNSYSFDEITVRYTQIESNTVSSVSAQPSPVIIKRYYTDQALDIPLQPLKGYVEDNAAIIRGLLITCLLLFFILSGVLIISVIRKRDVNAQSIAEQIQKRFKHVKQTVQNRRKKLIEYEKLILSIFRSYGSRTALGFWQPRISGERSLWTQSGAAIKPALESAYCATGPEDKDIQTVETNFDRVYMEIEQQSTEERAYLEQKLQGNVRQRIKKNSFNFIAGFMAAIIGFIFLYLSINQHVWINQDAQVFNKWIDSLPDRLLEEEKRHELNNLDIEMLGHISDEQRVLENTQSDLHRSRYLYNYGTLATIIYKSILLMPPQDEEEEVPEPPTFEFPLLLMANSARFNPEDEDVRRNLEIIIDLKESQKKEEGGEVEGELGPPTPGFSRDMNPLLF